ncbi:MAG: GNVR domain-containing protein [Terracidiphilus sp.]
MTGTDLLPQPNEDEFAAMEEEGGSLSVSFVRFLRLIGARRRIVLSILTAGILISVLYAYMLPNIYTSTTTLMPPGNTSSFGSFMSLLSNNPDANITDEMLGMGSPGELFVAILGSSNVQNALITRFSLMHYYRAHTMMDARKELAADTTISEDDKSGIITISVNALSPQLAAQLAQDYVTELNRVVTDDSTSSARREREFLEARVGEVKHDLDESSKVLSQFSTKSGAFDIHSQAVSMVDAGLKLQAQLIDGRSELAALKQSYSEDNARVKAMEASNAELERQIDALGGASHARGAAPDGGGSPYPSVSELPALGLTYYDLERKVHVDEELWETLTKEYEIAKVEEVKQVPTVRVLDVANVPERKSAPSKRLIVMIGTVLAVLVAFLVVFGLDRWEEMDPAAEPKQLITEIAGTVLRLRRRRKTTVEVQ